MSDKRKTTVVLVSYWPLLDYAAAGYSPGQAHALSDRGNLKRIEKALADAAENCASACVWCRSRPDDFPTIAPGTYFPVLVYPRARDIARHLRAWAEDRPEAWFDLVVADTYAPTSDPPGDSRESPRTPGDSRENSRIPGNRYCVALMPRIQMSIDRWRTGYCLRHGQPAPADYEFNVLFQPLVCGSVDSPAYSAIRDRLNPVGQDIPVGVLDKDVFLANLGDPGRISVDAIVILGCFRRAAPDDYRDWLDSFLASLESPRDDSIPAHWVNNNHPETT